ncbi:Diaminohydroxyphosphoribosylaminopyrimidine deaminase [Desulfosporosinus sp. I2]|nr:Diaminohydroxyphosphoribosylaminopyrimidine deaminase [Desulfosporosinus sp. I2]
MFLFYLLIQLLDKLILVLRKEPPMERSSPSDLQDPKYMKRALALAVKAIGRTSPNPLVGCVIVKDDQIVGEGYHHQAGTPHAEVNALQAAGDQAYGATAYVTLEPCSHFGRTPPCADALIRAEIKRVVIAMRDPNPLVAGRGIERLLKADIEVDVGLMNQEATLVNEIFIKAITTGLPFVLYKSAMTLDGKIATETGDSCWVSSEKSRNYVHQLRDHYDVILVGSETVIRDNPMLTCRLLGGRDPVRVVVDGQLRIPETAQILSVSNHSPCIIATTRAASDNKVKSLQSIHPQVEIWQYDTARQVPLKKLLSDLVLRGWTSVLLEGGGGLAGSMMKESCIDKVEFFIAPKLVGGQGPSPLSGLRIQTMADALVLDNLQVDMETGDLHVTGYLRY